VNDLGADIAETVRRLQCSMLPDEPPELTGARVAYRYLPAREAARVGGDWFDAIPLPGNRVAITVGSVLRHGLTSAAIMGQLRAAVRVLAAQDLPPDRVLSGLDDLARRLGEPYTATFLYAVYDPLARSLRIADAGHLPPVLVTAAGATPLPVPPGAPIGVGAEGFEVFETRVEDGSRLVLGTDGLMGGQAPATGQALAERVAACADAADFLHALAPAAGAEDIALLLVELTGIPDGDVASWELVAEPRSVPWARGQIRRCLDGWGRSELADTMELLVSELVTNALVHGAGAIWLRLIRGSVLLCEVGDDGPELPYIRDAADTDESGRGLQLVSVLARSWGTYRTATGKVVWFEHPLD